MSNTARYVYLIHAPSQNLVKIGMTGKGKSGVAGRLSGVQTSSPVPVALLGVIEDDSEMGLLESELHGRYSTYRVKGEWFDDSVINEILRHHYVENYVEIPQETASGKRAALIERRASLRQEIEAVTSRLRSLTSDYECVGDLLWSTANDESAAERA